MFAQPIEAALFDMDGLLIDTEAVYLKAYQAAALDMSVDMPLSLIHAMIGVPTPDCKIMIQGHFGPAFDVEQFHLCTGDHAERLMAEGVPVKPGARELVDFLHGQGLPMAIATSSRVTSVQRRLGSAGLLDRFSAIATRYDVPRAKPHPDVYLEAARRLSVRPERCVAFEDSAIGLAAAHAAGTMAIMVPDIVAPTAEVRAKCLHVADDLHAVLVLLRPHLGARASRPAHDAGLEPRGPG
jgi:HAD superfamily hydrolase (TIGR01509 family)